MNPEDSVACETPIEDHIVCLIEYLRRSDARMRVEGDLWSANFGPSVQTEIADRLEATLSNGERK